MLFTKIYIHDDLSNIQFKKRGYNKTYKNEKIQAKKQIFHVFNLKNTVQLYKVVLQLHALMKLL